MSVINKYETYHYSNYNALHRSHINLLISSIIDNYLGLPVLDPGPAYPVPLFPNPPNPIPLGPLTAI